MNLQPYIQQLVNLADADQAIDAARALAGATNNAEVMDALCLAAVRTDSHKLRETLIEVLETNSAGACVRFSNDALWSQNPTVRKWALVNLSLMRCRDAKDAVISGLYDVDAAVRMAAAINTGLYDDADVKAALDFYFEHHRLDLALSMITDGFGRLSGTSCHPEDEDISISTVLI